LNIPDSPPNPQILEVRCIGKESFVKFLCMACMNSKHGNEDLGQSMDMFRECDVRTKTLQGESRLTIGVVQRYVQSHTPQGTDGSDAHVEVSTLRCQPTGLGYIFITIE
jgi:hypothetical protein